MPKDDSIIIEEETLKIYHEQKIESVRKKYSNYEVEIIECIPLDVRTEKIIFSIKKEKKEDLSI